MLSPYRVTNMESAASSVTEEAKCLPGFLKLLATLVFPVLFELRNDPRVKNTPKIQILFSQTDFATDSEEEEFESQKKDEVVEEKSNPSKAMKLIVNSGVESTVKHTAKKLYEGQQPCFGPNGINGLATSIDLNESKKSGPIPKIENIESKNSQTTKEEVKDYQPFEALEAETNDVDTVHSNGGNGLSHWKPSEHPVSPSRSAQRIKSNMVERIPIRFRPPTLETTESQLSSWSSVTADNSLSDLYCDDELKMSLEYDPNMQLFCTIDEETDQEQEIMFPEFRNMQEETFLSMSGNTERSDVDDLSINSLVNSKYGSGSYSIGFTSIEAEELKISLDDVKKPLTSKKSRRGTLVYSENEDSSDSEESISDDFSPNPSPHKDVHVIS